MPLFQHHRKVITASSNCDLCLRFERTSRIVNSIVRIANMNTMYNLVFIGSLRQRWREPAYKTEKTYFPDGMRCADNGYVVALRVCLGIRVLDQV